LSEQIEVRLPETTEDVMESLVVFWHRSVGDRVEQGEVLVEVQTEKAVFEVEAPASGRITQIFVKRGEVAAVGEVLAVIEQMEEDSRNVQQVMSAANEKQQKAISNQQAEPLSVKASPRVRRLARELGVDLSVITGTGPSGRITESDVQNALKQFKPNEQTVELTAFRRTIAKRMMKSLQHSAQLTENAWADVTALSKQRKQLAPEVSWNTWILRAVVLALMEHTYINAVWEENGIRQFDYVHLGVAVDTEDGLLVPSIQHAERLTLFELHEAVSQVVQKARLGKLSSSELSGSTFTVTNLGSYGIQFFTPIINPPEAGILGVGQIEKQIVFADEKLEQRERLPLSLTFDHRILDGAPAARFLQTLVQLLGDPKKIL
jgi:pyruvate dehydrogenase E2 component (dihydrolipoamide acetyltransferase)